MAEVGNQRPFFLPRLQCENSRGSCFPTNDNPGLTLELPTASSSSSGHSDPWEQIPKMQLEMEARIGGKNVIPFEALVPGAYPLQNSKTRDSSRKTRSGPAIVKKQAGDSPDDESMREVSDVGCYGQESNHMGEKHKEKFHAQNRQFSAYLLHSDSGVGDISGSGDNTGYNSEIMVWRADRFLQQGGDDSQAPQSRPLPASTKTRSMDFIDDQHPPFTYSKRAAQALNYLDPKVLRRDLRFKQRLPIIRRKIVNRASKQVKSTKVWRQLQAAVLYGEKLRAFPPKQNVEADHVDNSYLDPTLYGFMRLRWRDGDVELLAWIRQWFKLLDLLSGIIIPIGLMEVIPAWLKQDPGLVKTINGEVFEAAFFIPISDESIRGPTQRFRNPSGEVLLALREKLVSGRLIAVLGLIAHSFPEGEHFHYCCSKCQRRSRDIWLMVEPKCYHKLCLDCVNSNTTQVFECPVTGCGHELHYNYFRPLQIEDLEIEEKLDWQRCMVCQRSWLRNRFYPISKLLANSVCEHMVCNECIGQNFDDEPKQCLAFGCENLLRRKDFKIAPLRRLHLDEGAVPMLSADAQACLKKHGRKLDTQFNIKVLPYLVKYELLNWKDSAISYEKANSHLFTDQAYDILRDYWWDCWNELRSRRTGKERPEDFNTSFGTAMKRFVQLYDRFVVPIHCLFIDLQQKELIVNKFRGERWTTSHQHEEWPERAKDMFELLPSKLKRHVIQRSKELPDGIPDFISGTSPRWQRLLDRRNERRAPNPYVPSMRGGAGPPEEEDDEIDDSSILDEDVDPEAGSAGSQTEPSESYDLRAVHLLNPEKQKSSAQKWKERVAPTGEVWYRDHSCSFPFADHPMIEEFWSRRDEYEKDVDEQLRWEKLSYASRVADGAKRIGLHLADVVRFRKSPIPDFRTEAIVSARKSGKGVSKGSVYEFDKDHAADAEQEVITDDIDDNDDLPPLPELSVDEEHRLKIEEALSRKWINKMKVCNFPLPKIQKGDFTENELAMLDNYDYTLACWPPLGPPEDTRESYLEAQDFSGEESEDDNVEAPTD